MWVSGFDFHFEPYRLDRHRYVPRPLPYDWEEFDEDNPTPEVLRLLRLYDPSHPEYVGQELSDQMNDISVSRNASHRRRGPP